jgi:hypothetical protein
VRLNAEVGANGYRLTRISSPALGLRSPDYCQTGSYQWLDDARLLFYLLTGQEEGIGTADWSYPLVADLDQQHIWAPDLTSQRPIGNCNEEPAWSSAMNRLYSPTDGKILVYLLSGSRLALQNSDGSVWLLPDLNRADFSS